MKKIITFLSIFVFTISLLYPAELAFSRKIKKQKKKVIVSALTSKLSANFFAMSGRDLVPVKKGKEVFTFNDKKIIWSAAIRGGLGKYNRKDYQVNWYSPGGELYKKQVPKFILIDCTGLKSEFEIKKDALLDKIGLWKLEVIYESQIIDEKFFYLGNNGNKKITEGEKENLNSILQRDVRVSTDKEKAVKLNQENKASDALEANIDEKASRSIKSSFLKTGRDDYEPIMHKGITYISAGSSKIYLKVEFPPFFGVSSPKVIVYWITPKKDVYREQKFSFFPTNDLSSKIKLNNILKDHFGKWKVVTYINKKKADEEEFILQSQQDFHAFISDLNKELQERERDKLQVLYSSLDLEDEKLTKEERKELTKIIKGKFKSINYKYIKKARKKYPNARKKKRVVLGDLEEYVVATFGKPKTMMLRKDGIEIWYYFDTSEGLNMPNVMFGPNREMTVYFRVQRGTLRKIFLEKGIVIETTIEKGVYETNIR